MYRCDVAPWYNSRAVFVFVILFFMVEIRRPVFSNLLALVVVVGVGIGLIFVLFVRPYQKQTALNTQRSDNTNAIVVALDQLRQDNGGQLPVVVPTLLTPIGSSTGEFNPCASLVPSYLAAMPYDFGFDGAHFSSCADYETGYEISRDAFDNITVRVR